MEHSYIDNKKINVRLSTYRRQDKDVVTAAVTKSNFG